MVLLSLQKLNLETYKFENFRQIQERQPYYKSERTKPFVSSENEAFLYNSKTGFHAEDLFAKWIGKVLFTYKVFFLHVICSFFLVQINMVFRYIRFQFPVTGLYGKIQENIK